MNIKNKYLFSLGILILLILLVSYFLTVQTIDGNLQTFTPLLGILIFYNPIVLIIYILLALFLIYKGIGKKIKVV